MHLPPNAVIDLRLIDSIRSLNTEGRPDLLAELVTIFRETTPALLDHLETSVTQRNAAVVQRIAHRLKGGSGNVGARHLSRLCAELEGLAREHPDAHDELGRYAREIRSAYDEALGALKSLI